MELTQPAACPTVDDLTAALAAAKAAELEADCRAAFFEDAMASGEERIAERLAALQDALAGLDQWRAWRDAQQERFAEREARVTRAATEVERAQGALAVGQAALRAEWARLAGGARCCAECGRALPSSARVDAKFCSGRCRARACRGRAAA